MIAKKPWVVIPAHNEEEHIKLVIIKVKRAIGKGNAKRIIVVDDGSRDRTAEIAKGQGVVLVSHITNLGKGSALKTGCDYAHRRGKGPIVVLDADAQHDPTLIPQFLEALEKVDLVLSFRKLDKNMPFIMRLGNALINQFIRLLYGAHVKDSQSGYRAFSHDAYPLIRWEATDYSMESEMIARMAKRRLRFTQIPIKTVYQDRYKGTTIFDGLKIVFDLMRWRITKL